jgi:Holliday junction DNA helicase RuvB
MRIYCRFNHYSVKDLIEIVRQRANLLNWQYESDDVLRIISKRAKGIPRLALNVNLQTCWHVAKSYRRDVIMLEDVKEAFDHLQIDEFGLDKLDRTYLALLSAYDSVPLNVLSSKLSLPARTIQRVLEPYLIKNGLIIKDKSSLRILTDKGRRHINNFQ